MAILKIPIFTKFQHPLTYFNKGTKFQKKPSTLFCNLHGENEKVYGRGHIVTTTNR
jgi:hypothetical protein